LQRGGVQWGNGRSAISADLGRDALTNFPFATAVDEPELVGMGMDVDEARREREPVGRNAFVRIAIGKVPDRDDPTVCDGDISGERRSAEAVEDQGALEDGPEQRLT
jgi:hypothetical protein